MVQDFLMNRRDITPQPCGWVTVKTRPPRGFARQRRGYPKEGRDFRLLPDARSSSFLLERFSEEFPGM